MTDFHLRVLTLGISSSEIELWIQQAWELSAPSIWQSLLILLGGLISYFLARWILYSIQNRFTSKTETDIDDCIVRLLRRTLLMSVLFGVLWQIALVWDLTAIVRMLSALWVVALSFPVARFVSDLLEIVENRIVGRSTIKLDNTVLPLANRVIQFLVVGVGVLSGMLVMDWEITPLLGLGGVAGLALSFAAKDTLSNLISGFLVILDQPFKVGDRIEVWRAPRNTATWGDVVEIGFRATKIKTTDNLIIVIPNAEIMQRDIINYTASGDHIRMRIPISIGYGADVELAKQLVLEVASSLKEVLETPSPAVIIRRFGDSSVDLEARLWIENARLRRNIEDLLTDGVKIAFDREGIEIPFPKRDIYVRNIPADSKDS